MRGLESKNTHCNLCGQRGENPLLIRKAEQRMGFGTAEVYRCSACKGVHLGEVPSSFNDDLYSYYDRYRSLSREQIYLDLTRSRYDELLQRLEPVTGGRKHFLDVGCGLGLFAEVATSRGWSGYGIDLADSAIEIALGFGIPVEKMDFFNEDLKPGTFDLITMFELIEHVPDPGRFFARAEKLLRPSGLLYLTTPNFNSIDRFVLKADWEAIHVEHLSYFTPSSISDIVKRETSFEIVEIKTKNISAKLAKKLVPRRALARGIQHSEKQAVRHGVDRSPALRGAKTVLNAVLSASGLGSSMAIILRKSSA